MPARVAGAVAVAARAAWDTSGSCPVTAISPATCPPGIPSRTAPVAPELYSATPHTAGAAAVTDQDPGPPAGPCGVPGWPTSLAAEASCSLFVPTAKPPAASVLCASSAAVVPTPLYSATHEWV